MTTKTTHSRISKDEISISIPEKFKETVKNLMPLSVVINFKSEGNKCGLQFVISSTGSKGDYMYCAPYNNGSSSVFPCVEFNQPCEWYIEIISPNADMIVISNGNLISKNNDVYLFHLPKKTTARNILFFVGEFEIVVDEKFPQISYYCPPHFLEYLKMSTAPMANTLTFLQSKTQMDFPFDTYKAVFVEYLLDDYFTSATVTLFHTDLLHNNRIVEQMFKTPYLLAAGLCEQYFGAYIEPKKWTDSWICWGLAEYLAGEFVKETSLEEQEKSTYKIKCKMNKLVKYEKTCEGIVLDASFYKDEMPFNAMDLRAMPQRYKKYYRIKSGLVVRSWVLSVSIRKVMNAFKLYLNEGNVIDYSVVEKTCLGRWKSLIENLIKKRGHLDISAKAHYHRKQRMIELVVGQSNQKGTFLYPGCMDIGIQEPDGLFQRVIKIKPEIVCHIELTMCSKISHLTTGQKLITRNRNEIEGPILGWVNLDPKMRLIGKVVNAQNENQTILAVKNESNVEAILSSLLTLESC